MVVRRYWTRAVSLVMAVSAAPARAQGPADLPPLPPALEVVDATAAAPAVAPSPAPAPDLPLWEPYGRPPGGLGASLAPAPASPAKPCPACGGKWWRRHAACKRSAQACFLGYPEKFVQPPLGSVLYAHGQTMVRKGDAGRMILHRFDFIDGTDRLSDRGRAELVRMAGVLAVSPLPLVVEATPSVPGLDAARRAAVLNELARGPVPVAADRVVVGIPITPGINGTESEIIYSNMLGRTTLGSPPLNVNITTTTSPAFNPNSSGGPPGTAR